MKRFTRNALFAFALLTGPAGVASAAGQGKTVDGMEIFYGVVPAEVIAKPTDKHDAKMHGGRLSKKGSHHLVVSLADAKSGNRIEDAAVVATVTPLGMAPIEKSLEAMRINDTTTYGNYFDFPASSGPFRIALKITRPSVPEHNAVRTEFEYRPPTGK